MLRDPMELVFFLSGCQYLIVHTVWNAQQGLQFDRGVPVCLVNYTTDPLLLAYCQITTSQFLCPCLYMLCSMHCMYVCMYGIVWYGITWSGMYIRMYVCMNVCKNIITSNLYGRSSEWKHTCRKCKINKTNNDTSSWIWQKTKTNTHGNNQCLNHEKQTTPDSTTSLTVLFSLCMCLCSVVLSSMLPDWCFHILCGFLLLLVTVGFFLVVRIWIILFFTVFSVCSQRVIVLPLS